MSVIQKAKFYGGSLDGQERESRSMGGGFGYRYVASVYENPTGTADDFRMIDLDVVHGHKPRPQKLVVETYVRDRDHYERDSQGEITMIAFKLESVEPYKP